MPEPTTDQLRIRLLMPADAPAMLELGHSGDEVRRWIESAASSPAPTKERTYVAVDATGRLLGSTFTKPLTGSRGVWIVGATRVSEAARSRGVGRAMGARRDADLAALGGRLTFSYIRVSNAPSIAMARKNGYSSALSYRTQIEPDSMVTDAEFSAVPAGSRRELRAFAKRVGMDDIVAAEMTERRPFGILPPLVHPWKTLVRTVLDRSAGYGGVRVLRRDARDVGLLVDDGAERAVIAFRDEPVQELARGARAATGAVSPVTVYSARQPGSDALDPWGIHVKPLMPGA